MQVGIALFIVIIIILAVDFFVRCESPELVISVGNKAMALYCVSSTHAATEYFWQKIGSTKRFPSTPVIYTNEAGLYQCCLKYSGREIKGKIVTVHLDVGM